MESEKKIASTTVPVIIHEPSSPDERMFASRSKKVTSKRNISDYNKSLVFGEEEVEKLQVMESNSGDEDNKGLV